MDRGHRQRQGVMLELVRDVQKQSSDHVCVCVCQYEKVRERETEITTEVLMLGNEKVYSRRESIGIAVIR